MKTFLEWKKWSHKTYKTTGPHEGDELSLMLAGKKPSALVDDDKMNQFDHHIKSGEFIHTRFKYGGLPYEHHANIVSRHDEPHRHRELVKQLSSNKRDHAKLGILLGYHRDDIKHFIKKSGGRYS